MTKATEKLYSISELAKLTTLDRATVTKRLDAVAHSAGLKGAKTYRLADALPALIAGESTEYDEAKLRKMQAEADLKEMEAEQERGGLLPAAEVRGHLQDLFKRLHQRTAVQLPRELGPQLYKAESAGQITEMLQRELGRVFNELRSDHQSFQ